MQLVEISEVYAAEAARLRRVLRELRQQRKRSDSATERAGLTVQIGWKRKQLSEAQKLAELCKRYYEPGYYRDPDYTLQEVVIYDKEF